MGKSRFCRFDAAATRGFENGLRLAEIHNSGKPCRGGCRSLPASMSLAGVGGFGPKVALLLLFCIITELGLPPTNEKFAAALRKIANGKSPGESGITPEALKISITLTREPYVNF
jgi:hypothetical protein